MNDTYLRSCHRGNDSLCPIFRLGDIVRGAGEKFPEMAVEVGSAAVMLTSTTLTYVLTLKMIKLVQRETFFLLLKVFSFPVLATGGRHWHPDQMGLQPGPTHAALPPQILLQAAG